MENKAGRTALLGHPSRAQLSPTQALHLEVEQLQSKVTSACLEIFPDSWKRSSIIRSHWFIGSVHIVALTEIPQKELTYHATEYRNRITVILLGIQSLHGAFHQAVTSREQP